MRVSQRDTELRAHGEYMPHEEHRSSGQCEDITHSPQSPSLMALVTAHNYTTQLEGKALEEVDVL